MEDVQIGILPVFALSLGAFTLILAFFLQSLSQFFEGKKCVSAYSYAFCMFTVEADMEKEGKKEKRRAGEDGGV